MQTKNTYVDSHKEKKHWREIAYKYQNIWHVDITVHFYENQKQFKESPSTPTLRKSKETLGNTEHPQKSQEFLTLKKILGILREP